MSLADTQYLGIIENILDQVIFIKNGQIVKDASVESIREEEGMSIDALFREVFRC